MQSSDRVLTIGTFDLLHVGHVRHFKAAAKLGKLTVAVNTDAFAARYKRKPVQPLAERKELVGSVRWVEHVLTNYGNEDSRWIIEAVQPRFLVHGDDWTGLSYLIQLGVTQDWLDSQGVELVYLPYTKGVSTTQILERLCQPSQ